MGRHSAPDEPDAQGRPDDGAAVVTGPAYRPRRARPDTDDESAAVDATTRDDRSDRTSTRDDAGPRGPGTIREALREPAQRPQRPVERRRTERAPREFDETARIEMVVDAELDAPVPEAVTEQFGAIRDDDDVRGPAPVPDAARNGGESDLDLLRGNSAVRARVIAAVLVPFLLYAGVLFGIGAMTGRTFLIWIWVPLVSAGVLAGLILDTAHRGRPVASAPDVATKDDPRDDDGYYRYDDEAGPDAIGRD